MNDKIKILPHPIPMYSPELARKITEQGRCILEETIDKLTEAGFDTSKIRKCMFNSKVLDDGTVLEIRRYVK